MRFLLKPVVNPFQILFKHSPTPASKPEGSNRCDVARRDSRLSDVGKLSIHQARHEGGSELFLKIWKLTRRRFLVKQLKEMEEQTTTGV